MKILTDVKLQFLFEINSRLDQYANGTGTTPADIIERLLNFYKDSVLGKSISDITEEYLLTTHPEISSENLIMDALEYYCHKKENNTILKLNTLCKKQDLYL